MEKILKEESWFTLYEITDSPFAQEPNAMWVELGVKYCPSCNHAYCMRFINVFKCDGCSFEYKIKTPFSIKATNCINRWGYALAPIVWLTVIGIVAIVSIAIKILGN